MQILPRAASAAFCVLLLFFAFNTIQAATRTSIGSGAWNSPTTWLGNTIPQSGDNVTIATGTTVALNFDENLGSNASITVQSGAVLDLQSNLLTAGQFVAVNGSLVRQSGTRTNPATQAASIQLAPNSTYEYYGTNTSLGGTHPTYGNLTVATSASTGSNGSIQTSLTVLGTFTLNLDNSRELTLRSGANTSFGSLVIERGVFVVNGTSGTATLNINGDVTILPGTGVLRGTNSTGHAVLNIGGSLTNNGAFQQDRGSSTANFTVNLNGASAQHISGTNPIAFEHLTVNNSAGVVFDRDVQVDKTLTLTSGSIDSSDHTLSLGCTTTIANAGEARYVAGYLAKNVCATGAFTFPVGTDSGYSPVSVNVSALSTNPSTLTVGAFNGPGPGVEPANSVTRFWNVVEDGDLTADLTFAYRDADVTTPAAESSFSLVKKEGNAVPTVVCTGSGCIDAAANTASVSGVSNFSRWSIGMPLAPSSAEAMVTGRILTAEGRAIDGAFITAIGTDGRVRWAISNQFGYYSFRGLTAGEIYTLSIRSKNYTFEPSVRVVTLNDAESHLDFIATVR